MSEKMMRRTYKAQLFNLMLLPIFVLMKEFSHQLFAITCDFFRVLYRPFLQIERTPANTPLINSLKMSLTMEETRKTTVSKIVLKYVRGLVLAKAETSLLPK